MLEPARTRVEFATRSGNLIVERAGDVLTMDFPALPPTPADASALALAAALGATPTAVLATRSLVGVFDDAESVRRLRPDLTAVAALGCRGVIVTAPGSGVDGDVDFVSRFFAPAQGVSEDPVTGSAHCTLTPYWAARLGKPNLRARQVSARGGEIACTLRGDRVDLAGRAVLVIEGVLRLPESFA